MYRFEVFWLLPQKKTPNRNPDHFNLGKVTSPIWNKKNMPWCTRQLIIPPYFCPPSSNCFWACFFFWRLPETASKKLLRWRFWPAFFEKPCPTSGQRPNATGFRLAKKLHLDSLPETVESNRVMSFLWMFFSSFFQLKGRGSRFPRFKSISKIKWFGEGTFTAPFLEGTAALCVFQANCQGWTTGSSIVIPLAGGISTASFHWKGFSPGCTGNLVHGLPAI